MNESYVVTIKHIMEDGNENVTTRSMPELSAALSWAVGDAEGEDRFILQFLAGLVESDCFEEAWFDAAKYPDEPSPQEFYEAARDYLQAWKDRRERRLPEMFR